MEDTPAESNAPPTTAMQIQVNNDNLDTRLNRSRNVTPPMELVDEDRMTDSPARTTSHQPVPRPSQGPEQPSYWDITAKLANRKDKQASIPWSTMPKNTTFNKLPKAQQMAIKRAQHALAPLSRGKLNDNRQGLTTVYFGNVRRTPYHQIYRALNKIIDRHRLRGVSLIGADVIEILVEETAAPSMIQKMRFMQWDHLPHFNPEKHDGSHGEKKEVDGKQRIHAAYNRWYVAWKHAKNVHAKEWYANNGTRLFHDYNEYFISEPAKETFQKLADTLGKQGEQATEPAANTPQEGERVPRSKQNDQHPSVNNSIPTPDSPDSKNKN